MRNREDQIGPRLRYNDSSPLENHHCARRERRRFKEHLVGQQKPVTLVTRICRAFETALNGVDCNIFEELSASERDEQLNGPGPFSGLRNLVWDFR